MTCRLCRAETAGDRCEDRQACRRRTRANMRRAVASMKTPKWTVAREKAAYEAEMRRR